MEQQEIFDKVVSHLREQNSKSLNEFGFCAYRGLEGRKCAIGIFIPDHIYRPSMEGTSIYWLMKEHSNLADILGRCHMTFYGLLQEIHDKYPVSEWESQFCIVAAHYGLTYNPPT